MQWQGWSDARTSRVETETRQRQDFRDRAKARQAEKHHYITQACFTVGPTWSLSLGRRIYAVVCWFHSSGLQLLAACRAFTVLVPRSGTCCQRGHQHSHWRFFCQRLKTWLFIRWHHLNCYPSDHLLTVFNPEVALQLRHYDWLTDWLTDQWSLRIEA